MTDTTGTTGVTSETTPSLAVRARDVLASEWTKLRSVRSNFWTLLGAALVTIAAAGVVARAFVTSHTAAPGGLISPLTESFLGYAEYAVLPISILGVLAITSEFGTGLIRTTFIAEPRRWAVLAAKATVTGAAALVAGELLAVASFLLTQAVLGGRHGGLSLLHSGVVAPVLAAGLVLAACVLSGVGLGAIIRRAPGAIAATIGVIYLLAALCLSLPSPWNDRIGRFTLALAAAQLVARHPQPGLLSPAVSLLVVLAWPTALLIIGGVLMSRRDA